MRYERNPTHRDTAVEVINSLAPNLKARPSDADQVVLEFADLEERKRSRRQQADANRISESDDEDDESMAAIDQHLQKSQIGADAGSSPEAQVEQSKPQKR